MTNNRYPDWGFPVMPSLQNGAFVPVIMGD